MEPQAIVQVERQSGAATVVTLHGEHDLNTATEIRDALGVASTYGDVIIDLAACTFVDSTIISILLQTANDLHTRGGLLKLVIPPGSAPNAQRVFEMLGVQRVLPIHQSRSAAQEHLHVPKTASTATGMRLRVLSEAIDEFQAGIEAEQRG
jgi:anti-anti-sigma factor